MLTAEDIRNIIIENFKTLFNNSFQILIKTTIGTPIPVLNPLAEQKFWFVPLLQNNKVRGSVILDTNGKIVLHGILSPNVVDEESLIDKKYFEGPPDEELNEIKKFYNDYKISSAFFSFDLIPQKWGWLIRLKNYDRGNEVSVFIGPDGWYEKLTKPDFEG